MLSDVSTLLRAQLKGATRIAVLGIGSEIRGDDRAGLLVVRLLQRRYGNTEHLRAYYGSTAPENLVGEIKRFRPSHLLLVDAADTGKPPGTIEIIPAQSVSGISASTHAFPVNVLADYMCQSIGCEVVLVGIQPQSLEFNEALTQDVVRAAREFVRLMEEIVALRSCRAKC